MCIYNTLPRFHLPDINDYNYRNSKRQVNCQVNEKWPISHELSSTCSAWYERRGLVTLINRIIIKLQILER